MHIFHFQTRRHQINLLSYVLAYDPCFYWIWGIKCVGWNKMTTPLCLNSFMECSYPRLKHKRIRCEQLQSIYLSTEWAYVPHTHQQPNRGYNLQMAIPKVTIPVCHCYSVCLSVWNRIYWCINLPSLLMHWTPNLTSESSAARMPEWFNILDYKSCRFSIAKTLITNLQEVQGDLA